MDAGPDFLLALRSLLGPQHVLTGTGLEAYEQDARKRYHGLALAVARPADVSQLQALVRLCAQHRVPMVPQGGNTGLVGGGVPDGSGRHLVVSLQRLRAIRQLDAANLTLVAEAGCTLQVVQEAASAAGLLFPLSLASEGSCTLGGNLATNAGGTQVLRYGNARELCLGLEVVTAEGERWDGLSGLRKDNTGYDLRHLFIGSEGTLGFITAATLKLYPAPRAQLTALAACRTVADTVSLLMRAQTALGAGLTAFELMNAQSLSLVARHQAELSQPWPPAPWTVLLELSDSEDEAHAQAALERLMGASLAHGEVEDVVVAQSQAQAKQFWALRESVPLAQAREGLNIKHDISLPVSAISRFIEDMEPRLQQAAPGCRLVCFGHLGDGNLHFNVQAPDGVSAPDFLAAHERGLQTLVHDEVQARGGSFSAEHGIGAFKRDELARRKHPVALDLMRRIKQALDPQGLMNPGRML